MATVVISGFSLYAFVLGLPVRERAPFVAMEIYIISMFLTPTYIASGITHVARLPDVTLFEVSMLAGWRKVAVGRLLSMLIYLLPYAVLQSSILWLFALLTSTDCYLVGFFLVSVYFYTGLTLIFTLVKSRATSIVIVSFLLFASPFAVSTMLFNYVAYRLEMGFLLSLLTYLFNPLVTYWYSISYPGIISLSRESGLIAALIATVILYALYVIGFERMEIKA